MNLRVLKVFISTIYNVYIYILNFIKINNYLRTNKVKLIY